LIFAEPKKRIEETTVLKNGFLPSPSFRKLAGKARRGGLFPDKFWEGAWGKLLSRRFPHFFSGFKEQ